jgi:hypothetical protein
MRGFNYKSFFTVMLVLVTINTGSDSLLSLRRWQPPSYFLKI